MKGPIYRIARLSHVHESSKGLNSGFYFVLSSGAGRNRISEIRQYITSNAAVSVFNILLKFQLESDELSAISAKFIEDA